MEPKISLQEGASLNFSPQVSRVINSTRRNGYEDKTDSQETLVSHRCTFACELTWKQCLLRKTPRFETLTRNTAARTSGMACFAFPPLHLNATRSVCRTAPGPPVRANECQQTFKLFQHYPPPTVFWYRLYHALCIQQIVCQPTTCTCPSRHSYAFRLLQAAIIMEYWLHSLTHLSPTWCYNNQGLI